MVKGTYISSVRIARSHLKETHGAEVALRVLRMANSGFTDTIHRLPYSPMCTLFTLSFVFVGLHCLRLSYQFPPVVPKRVQ